MTSRGSSVIGSFLGSSVIRSFLGLTMISSSQGSSVIASSLRSSVIGSSLGSLMIGSSLPLYLSRVFNDRVFLVSRVLESFFQVCRSNANYFYDIYSTFDQMPKFDINGKENIRLTTSGITSKVGGSV